MSKNIELNGQTYNGVSEVEFPVSGGTALFKDEDEIVTPTGTKQITANGNGIDVAAYEKVDVNVSGGGISKTKIGTATVQSNVNTDNIVTLDIAGHNFNMIEFLTEDETSRFVVPYSSAKNTGSQNTSLRYYGSAEDETLASSNGFSIAARADTTVTSLQVNWIRITNATYFNTPRTFNVYVYKI